MLNENQIAIPTLEPTFSGRPLLEFSVPAGFPTPARDYFENMLDLNELMIEHPSATYFIKADGYSMMDANILPGDILVVDRALDALNNKIVIAVLDGDIIVKRLKIKNNNYWLYPENDEFTPIKIESWMNFSIWGVVTWIIHEAR